jgi:hypothetical protein
MSQTLSLKSRKDGRENNKRMHKSGTEIVYARNPREGLVLGSTARPWKSHPGNLKSDLSYSRARSPGKLGEKGHHESGLNSNKEGKNAKDQYNSIKQIGEHDGLCIQGQMSPVRHSRN